jgi:hypothetical protein
MSALIPTARVASLITRTFKSLAYASVNSYGARRVILSPPAIEAQNLFEILRYIFAAIFKRSLVFVSQY